MVLPEFVVTMVTDRYLHPIVGKPKDCLEGDGTSYKGSEEMTESGHKCKSWIPTKVCS